MGHHRCELLVPAGGKDQFTAAVENGADAVYIGGHLFNARINAGNFDDDELQAAVDFAHKRGVKVYVTMNTLLTDDELNDALRYAGFLYEAGADGLIIQDLGLGRLVREYMPDFPLHLSTQATVYDLRGVETAVRLGYERVVLARELSLAEIKDICRNTETEIEVFVHGALCICYSGQCQMSRYLGGRSGNRGSCAQPCRLPYRTSDSNGKPVDTFRYPLSPKDQCLIRELGSLVEAGVLSLKIEGRMKSAEYVAVVTSIYRKYLDLYYEKGSYTVSEEDLIALTQIFNRGGFTDDYLHGEAGMDLMAGELPKHRGVRIGKVIRRIQGTALLDVKLYDELAIGDGVEIQGRELSGNVVTYYKELKGGLTRIGDIKGRVSHGDPLFRISSKAQLDEARRTYHQVDFEHGKYLRRKAVDMRLTGNGGRLKLEVQHESGAVVDVESGPFPLNKGGSADIARLETALRKTGNTPFKTRKVDFDGNFEVIVKAAEINEMRRRALSKLEEALVVRRSGGLQLEYVPMKYRGPLEAVELFYYTWEAYIEHFVPEYAEYLDVPKVSLIPAVEFERHFDQLGGELVIPYISNVSRGREDQFIEEHFDSLAAHCADRGIYVGNISWIQPFRAAGIDVFGDYGLNVLNEQAAAALDAIGVRRCVYSLEAAAADNGAYPLMTMQHQPDGDNLALDGKAGLSIIRREFSDQTILVPDNVLPPEKIDSSLEILRIYIK